MRPYAFASSVTASRQARVHLSVAAVCLAAALAGQAGALTMIDCDSTADFCTGDPCITTDELQITVASCVLDFSPATLQLSDVVHVPNGGSLDLTAGAIVVERKIDGQHITN